MYCTQCGSKNPDTNKFCNQCGARLLPLAAEPAAAGTSPQSSMPRPVSPSNWSDYSQPGQPQKPRRWSVVAIIGAIVAVVLLVFIILPRLLGTSERHILVAFGERREPADVYLLREGQRQGAGTLVAEDAYVETDSFFRVITTGLDDSGLWPHQQPIGTGFGGFVPGTNHVLLAASEDDERKLYDLNIGARESQVIFALGSGQPAAYYLSEGKKVFVYSTYQERRSCYTGELGEELERLSRDSQCGFLSDAERAYAVENEGDRTTLTLMRFDGSAATTVLDGVAGVGADWRISSDASHFAYVEEWNRGVRLHIRRVSDGRDQEVSGEMRSISLQKFMPGTDILFYLADDGDGEQTLFRSDSAEPLAERVIPSSLGFPSEGRYLHYSTQEAQEHIAWVYDSRDDTSVEVANGWRAFSIPLNSPNRILALTNEPDGELSIYLADLDGRQAELIHRTTASVRGIYSVADDPYTLVRLADQEGMLSLLVGDLNTGETYELLHDWAELTLLNRSPDGKRLVFSGAEDSSDDHSLYVIEVKERAQFLELDGNSSLYSNAVFVPDGKAILYTASPDDGYASVYRVRISAKGSPVMVYRRARLLDVQWADIKPDLSVSDLYYLYLLQ